MSCKKINCKHGLTNEQELEARRLRRKIEENDAETMKRIAHLRNEWLKDSEWLFTKFLREHGHVVLSSAISRLSHTDVIDKVFDL